MQPIGADARAVQWQIASCKESHGPTSLLYVLVTSILCATLHTIHPQAPVSRQETVITNQARNGPRAGNTAFRPQARLLAQSILLRTKTANQPREAGNRSIRTRQQLTPASSIKHDGPPNVRAHPAAPGLSIHGRALRSCTAR